MAGARIRLRPWQVHGGFAVAIVAASVLYLTVPPHQRPAVFLAVIVLPILAITAGLRLNRIEDRTPWWLLMAGLAALAVPQALTLTAALDPATYQVMHHACRALGYLAMLSGAAVLVLRHAPHDPGGLLDSALIGVCGAGPIWTLVLRPRLLDAHVSTLAHLLRLIEILLVMLVLGSLLRTAATTVRGRGTLSYFFAAFCATLTGLNLTVLTGNPAAGTYPHWVNLVWFFGYLCAAAGALHPSARHIATPTGVRRDDLSDRRLLGMAAALAVTPLMAGVSQFVSGSTDSLVLVVGTLAAIPLVLLRFRQLAGQRRAAERSLAHLAAHDELTGLPNRRTLVNEVGQALDSRRTAHGHGVAVLFCDLDGFKSVNDSLGHEAGDEVLQIVGERMSQCVRASDVLGRFGGDEFLVLCPDATDADTIGIAQRIERALAEPVLVCGVTRTIGVSVGLAMSALSGADTADSLIARADAAMYELKRTRSRARGSVGDDLDIVRS